MIYPEVDDTPAGYSAKWLQGVLRTKLRFKGAIFSDDISMVGAGVVGSYCERAQAAIDAGCDMVLVCNNQDAAKGLLDELKLDPNPASLVRLMRMHGQDIDTTLEKLHKDEKWQSVSSQVIALEKSPELGLDDDQI